MRNNPVLVSEYSSPHRCEFIEILRQLLKRTVKYRNLKSFAHNFSHSFVSYENQVDGKYVIDDLRILARDLDGGVVSIYWIPNEDALNAALPARVLKSICRYREWLPILADQHQITLDTIEELRMDIYRKPNRQLKVLAHLKDDRGKIHEKSVKF